MKEYQFNLSYPINRKPISVDTLLHQLLIPRKWRHYLRIEKNILINNQYRNFNELVVPNDKIQLNLTHVESQQQIYPASNQLPKIVYEDKNIIIIDKPAGQKTHPNLNETNTALNDIATYLGRTPYIVHRLDMLTNGLLLVAKNPAVVPILNHQLVNKTLNREYLALVTGTINSNGTVELPIAHDPNDQRKRMVATNGLRAITHYQVLKHYDNNTLLNIKLETGRTHQIRVHLSAIGHPIIGDPLYNPNYQKGERLQLTAYRMKFIKPFSFEEKIVQKKI